MRALITGPNKLGITVYLAAVVVFGYLLGLFIGFLCM